MMLNRRAFLGSCAAALAAGLPATRAWTLTTDTAHDLISSVVTEIHRVINSGKAETAMYADFERIFSRYADVPTIARSTLGPDARRASDAQMTAFTRAFQGYISRKYGKRFREFIGGSINVQGAKAVQTFYEVRTIVNLRGESPFEVTFLVSDRSGKDLFFDMYIEGISLLRSERTEIGAMLDRRRGDLDAMIADLARAG